jgi:hypothetical protein
MSSVERKYKVPLAELIDRLTVNQIKEVLLSEGKSSYANEMEIIQHDINLIVTERGIALNARLLRIVIALSQLNLHIWHLKERMQQEPDKYDEFLKLAHQLNGIRNRMKNLLLEETGDREKSAQRSNVGVDGLTGWDVSV